MSIETLVKEDVMGEQREGLLLDGTKIEWHRERVEAWMRGERVAPITIDMALTRACNYACHFCYAMLQENDRQIINQRVIYEFLEDCAEIGVKAISLVSDGESTISPVFVDTVRRGSELGINMAVGTNAFALTRRKMEEILPHLTYLRVNFSAGEAKRYSEIMGVKESWFEKVCENIKTMMEIKKQNNLAVTIGMQMVLMPEYVDQIIPLAKLGADLQPDYLVIKHCSDNEEGSLGVNYAGYKALYDILREAETYSIPGGYQVVVKWSKIKAEGMRSYQRCFGAPLMLQMSGSGLVAPCGALFNEKYKKFHIGNIAQKRFKDIFHSKEYWDVMNYLASPTFNAQKQCASLCLQHKVNEYLDGVVKGQINVREPAGIQPKHINFV